MAVAQGISTAALKQAGVFGPTPPGTPETVSFVLRARDLRQLEQQVEAGMPGGYLSVSKFAGRYGQPQSAISALERYLSRYGITATAYADGLDVSASGTAGEFDSALSVQQHEYSVPAVPARHGRPGRPAIRIHGTTDSPLLPASLARSVLSILGLTSYSTFASDALHTPALSRGVRPSAVQTGSLTPADFARQYGLTSLYQKGATGAGQTIGIVTLASVRPSNADHFWNKILHIATKPGRITLDNVDGGSGPVSNALGSGETTLDVEQSGALAPDADIVVYQAPNTDYGFVDGFFTAASQNVAATVSTSWGESETYIAAAVNGGTESFAYAASFDEAFLEFAAQGQSSFVAVGDDGAYDARTTLAGTIPLSSKVSAEVSAQRTWGWDWLWPYYALFTNPATGKPFTSEALFAESNAAGGGGFSVFERTPAYQQFVRGTHSFSATEYLTPTDPETVAPGLTEPTQWIFNGSTALIDSLLGHRVGFWNPAIYQFATQRNSPFTPLDSASASNDNLYYTGTPGHIYNVGSGLGTPNLARLASDFGRGH